MAEEKPTNGQGEAGEEASAAGQAELVKLQGELATAKGQIQELQKAKSEQSLLSPAFLENLENLGGETTPPEPTAAPDFESMSTPDIVAHMTGLQTKALEELQEAMTKKFGAIEERVGRAMATVDLELAFGKHEDMRKSWSDKPYRDRYIALAEENTSWGAERIYQQLRLEAIAAAQDEAETKEAKKAEEMRALSEKGGVPAGATVPKDISAADAGRLAYGMVYGNEGKAEE